MLTLKNYSGENPGSAANASQAEAEAVKKLFNLVSK
jgi:hypothetical protein